MDPHDTSPTSAPPRVSLCIPHWQVEDLIRICLRSIRRHTPRVPVEVIVVDNGSQDDSLDYLRGLNWIRLIERRPDELPAHWVKGFVTALDVGFQASRGDYFVIMHTDTIIRRDDWLERMLEPMEADPRCAAVGAWKLEPSRPLYDMVKRVTDTKKARLWLRRTLLGDPTARQLPRELCPRDYCAMYRSSVLREHALSFLGDQRHGGYTAGEAMYYQLKDRGYRAAVLDTRDTMRYMVHLGHATAGLQPGQRALRHRRSQRKSERKVRRFFNIPEVKALQAANHLDQ